MKRFHAWSNARITLLAAAGSLLSWGSEASWADDAPIDEVGFEAAVPGYTVEMAYPHDIADPKGKGPFEVEIGQLLDVRVRRLGEWFDYLRSIQALDDTGFTAFSTKYPHYFEQIGTAGGHAPLKAPLPEGAEQWKNYVRQSAEQMCLYIDGKPFRDLTPRVFWVRDFSASRLTASTDLSNRADATGCPMKMLFRFDLSRPGITAAPETIARWEALSRDLCKDFQHSSAYRHHDISIGFPPTSRVGAVFLPSAVSPDSAETQADKDETLLIVPFSYVFRRWAIGGVALLIAGILVLGWGTNFLRDTSLPINPDGRYPFSLGLCQMALWLVIILGSYIFLCLSTGDHNRLSATALTLLGISSATGLGATLVNQASRDDRQKTALTPDELQIKDRTQLKALQTKEEVALQTAKSANDTDAVALSSSRIVELQGRIDYPTWKPAGIAYDLLREKDCFNLHRFQLVAWTIVLAFVFVCHVAGKLEMPDFNSSILILAGISSGTYVGFKFPEARSSAAKS